MSKKVNSKRQNRTDIQENTSKKKQQKILIDLNSLNTNLYPTTSNLYDKYLYSSTCERIAITYGINRLIKARKIIEPIQSIDDF